MYSKDAAIKELKAFLGLVTDAGIRVSSAFLFGSHSNGQPSEDSDIDVAIASPDFTGFRFDDLGKIAQCKIRSNPDIEVHPFAESDFNNDSPFAKEILETGLRIA